MVILKNYMLTEFNTWKEEMEYEYKPENDELLPYFETFNWTMAKMFLEHYLRRCMLRGQFDFMHWQSVQPKYPKDKFEALQKQFTLNKAQIFAKLRDVSDVVREQKYDKNEYEEGLSSWTRPIEEYE